MAKMHQGQYDDLKYFLSRLSQLRQLLSDVALLDLCEQHLNTVVSHIDETGGKDALPPAPPPAPPAPPPPAPAGATGTPGLAAAPPAPPAPPADASAAAAAPATDGGGTATAAPATPTQ